ncbi:MAG: peptidase M15 [Deltaproteobacteria bacterium]|nr:peptidase M15 [Deltaproteobacteria bacterium]
MKKTGKSRQADRNGAGSSPDAAAPYAAGPPDWSQIKHFTPREFTCKCDGLCDHADRISTELVAKLDMIRERIGLPIIVISGARCERHNRKVGGKERSAHVPRSGVSHAADVRCADTMFRFAFLAAALPVFRRIGIAKDFIHVDDDPDLPQGVIWVC